MTPKRYAMKTDPTYVVEAVQLHETDTDWGAVADWCGADVRVLGSPETGIYSLLELGLDGAVHGDWVVKQPGGWFVWPPAGFAAAFREAPACCDLHGRNCEQGGEECCRDCTEAHHFAPGHGGVPCSAPDLSGGGR